MKDSQLYDENDTPLDHIEFWELRNKKEFETDWMIIQTFKCMQLELDDKRQVSVSRSIDDENKFMLCFKRIIEPEEIEKFKKEKTVTMEIKNNVVISKVGISKEACKALIFLLYKHLKSE